MPEYSRILGDVVKVARGKSGLTQAEVAVAIHRDTRTVLNIENYKGNPKLEVLYPLVRTLKIDAREIFNPEMQLDSPALRQLRLLVNECSEEEAAAIIPIFQAALRLAVSVNSRPIRNRATICGSPAIQDQYMSATGALPKNASTASPMASRNASSAIQEQVE